jgi:spermidine synthase
MRKTEYLLSYLYPIEVERTKSLFNPFLEVVFYAGKYLLNSENGNYSNGSLHSLFKKIFRKLQLNWSEINNALILGFGTGSIAEIINKYKPACIIDGVEIDKIIIELGQKYFNTSNLKNVTIHCAGADHFLENSAKKYDLIIIDVYLDINVPEEIETEKFLIKVKNVMNDGGMVIFNKFIYSKKSRNQLSFLEKLYEKTFNNVIIRTIMTTGKIFIAKKTN